MAGLSNSGIRLQDYSNINQSSLQADLVAEAFKSLLSTLDIRNRARLLALSFIRCQCLAQGTFFFSLLGLSIVGAEFKVGINIWLVIPIFPSSPLLRCGCKRSIDVFDDHLLGCGNGAMENL